MLIKLSISFFRVSKHLRKVAYESSKLFNTSLVIVMRVKIALLLLFVCKASLGQNFSISEFGHKEGLVQNSIYCIYQDQKGLLWIGTDQGMYRFDGNRFKHYGSQEGISDNEIFNIQEAGDDFFLIVNFNGKINYYSKGVVYNDFNDRFLSQIHFESVPFCIRLSDSSFAIYSSSPNYFYQITVKNHRIDQLKKIVLQDAGHLFQVSVEQEHLVAIFIDSLGNLIRQKYTFHGEKIGEGASCAVWSYYPISDTTELQYSRNVFSVIHRVSRKEIFGGEVKSNIIACFEAGGDVWVTTTNGVSQFSNNTLVKEYFSHVQVNYVFEDRDGNIWIGTEGGGLKLLRESELIRVGKTGSQQSLNIRCIEALNSKDLVLGYDKLFFSIYEGQHKVTHTNLIPEGEFINRRILDIAATKEGDIAFATDEGTFMCKQSSFTKKGKRSEIENIVPIASKCLLLEQGSLYVGTCGELIKYNLHDKTADVIWNQRTVSVAIDKSKNIWFGSNTGLYKLNPENGSIQKIKGPLERRRINHMEWYDNTLYLATDLGVFRYDGKNCISILDQKGGLPSNTCLKVKNDSINLWIATPLGLCKVKKKANFSSLKVYKTSNGLSSNSIKDILINEGENTAYVATYNGLNILKINSIEKEEVSHVNVVEVYNNDTVFNVFEPIVLKKGMYSISIYFSSVPYNEDCTYKYRLLPNSKKWSNTTENTISFSGLDPGEYWFEVVALTSGGKESELPARVAFTIQPFFYQTILFKSSLGIFVLLLLGGSVYKYQRSLLVREKRKNDQEKKYASLELEAIKAQINPHFIYNCLNSIQHSIVTGANDSAEAQLSTFSKLVRETLDYSQVNFISLEQEIRYLTKYLDMEKIRFKEKLNFQIITSVENGQKLFLPCLLVQPYVENALKYGLSKTRDKPSFVKVTFKIQEERLFCYIEDTGVGLTKSNLSKKTFPSGIGLGFKRAETYNQLYGMDISIDFINKKKVEENASGTIVTINLPLKTKVIDESIYSG